VFGRKSVLANKRDLSSYMEIYEEMLRQVLMLVLLAVIME